MEQEILNIITKISYSDRIKELYDNRSENIEFPLKLDIPPNYKVISDFSDDYFDKYEYILVENALINALEDNNKEYLEFFKKNINNIKKQLENDKAFRNKTTELAIKNISLKILSNHNVDKKYINENKILFDTIKKIYTTIEPIFIKYRNIIINFLHHFETDEELQLDIFLLTNKFDNILIKENKDILNKENIYLFKKILIRLILSDNYLHIESILLETEIDNMINQINEKYYNKEILEEDILDDELEENEYLDEFEDDLLLDKTILEHIKKCIKNNEFILPTDKEIRLNLYSKFITYNVYFDNREYDYESIKEHKEKVLNLKKLNPLYLLEIKNKH